MKTKEEIEQLAEQLYPISPNPQQIIEGFERVAFKNGYTQCQQDMDDRLKKFEKTIIDLHRKHGYFQGDNLKVLIREFESLNKQD